MSRHREGAGDASSSIGPSDIVPATVTAIGDLLATRPALDAVAEERAAWFARKATVMAAIAVEAAAEGDHLSASEALDAAAKARQQAVAVGA